MNKMDRLIAIFRRVKRKKGNIDEGKMRHVSSFFYERIRIALEWGDCECAAKTTVSENQCESG